VSQSTRDAWRILPRVQILRGWRIVTTTSQTFVRVSVTNGKIIPNKKNGKKQERRGRNRRSSGEKLGKK